jgi:effector-binding domain-containing protein
MTIHCETVQQPDRPVLSIRTHSSVQDLPQMLGQCFGRVAQYLGELGEQPADAPFVAYYNMDMENLDLEIGFPVARELPGKEDIQPGVIPAGKSGVCTYTGPYPEMAPAYDALTAWVEQEGCHPSGVSYEFYLNSPAEVPPDQLITRIVFPMV